VLLLLLLGAAESRIVCCNLFGRFHRAAAAAWRTVGPSLAACNCADDRCDVRCNPTLRRQINASAAALLQQQRGQAPISMRCAFSRCPLKRRRSPVICCAGSPCSVVRRRPAQCNLNTSIAVRSLQRFIH